MRNAARIAGRLAATNAQVHRRFGSHRIPECHAASRYTPNAVFIDDPAVVSDKRLDRTVRSFFEDCCVLLTFRHNFNLEASELDPNLGFDGGVLELSTDGGNTFQDISPLAAALCGRV